MKTVNIFGENVDEIKSKFSQATSDGFSPTLAIVFCSITQNRKELASFFDENNVDVFGSTTAGEIIDSEVMEKSSVIMLLDIKKEHYKIFHEASEDTFKISNNLALFAKSSFSNPSVVVVSSGLTIDAEQIINGFHAVDKDIPLYGGLASDDLTMKGSFVFSNNYESSTGLIALVFDNDKINVQGIATSGWDNIGIEKTITKSDGNVVYTIDNEPAVDVFVKYFQF